MDKVDLSTVTMLNPSINPKLKPETRKTKGREGLRGVRRTFFSEFLEDATRAGELGPLSELAPSEEALAGLMDAVHNAGSDLLNRPFPEEILRYKKAVRNFIHYVVENSYEVRKVQGIKKKLVVRGETRWKETAYNQIQVIDRKLEELAAAILSGQASQLETVSKINEIKGLLVDLTISGAIRERDG
jgi:uncharacterized protein YaaR (DUF327 family)